MHDFLKDGKIKFILTETQEKIKIFLVNFEENKNNFKF